MSETESRTVPAVAPKPPWHQRLLGRWKWPGWAAIGLGSGRIFHLGEDIDFALNVVRSLGGELGVLATVLASPFFSLALIVYGVLHLIFVGEPKQALRHRAWTYVSWSIVAVCFVAITGTAIWGGIQGYIAQQVAVDRFWHLTDAQQRNLGKALDEIPVQAKFPIFIRMLPSNPQALTLGQDLANVFQQHGWAIQGTQDFTLRADLLGINFVVVKDSEITGKNAPPHAAELAHILDKAGIKYGAIWDPAFDGKRLELAIGFRPVGW